MFIRSQNTEILQTGYSFLTQNYDLVCKSTKDSEENFAFAVLCDKLRFFSSALNLNDKAKFIKKRDETVEKCNFDNSCFALSPLYLMAYEPSFAHAKINATTLCLPTCKKDFLGFYFALHGLYTYGYDDIATAWKNALYRSITTPLLDHTSLAILGEIILLN